ncbi:MAG: hypothetical protein JWN57_11, partial [Frankiales bacterium]|nr:hypothetical protein [Frankiales bacterium]
AEPTPPAAPIPSASPSASPSTGSRPVVARLPAPRVLGPVNGAAAKTVVLDWTAVAGADAYTVEVGTDEDWSDGTVLAVAVTSGATAYTLPVALPHASYVWRVAATTTAGQGRWSANGSFVKAWTARPGLLSPAPASSSTVTSFRWTPVPGASEYQLQISTSPTFPESASTDRDPTQTQGEPQTESCFTSRTELTPHVHHGASKVAGSGACSLALLNPSPQRPRYWRVRALDHFVGSISTLPTVPVADEGISHLPPQWQPEALDLTACPAPAADLPTAPIFGQPKVSPPSPSAVASPSPAASPAADADAPTTSCLPENPVEKGAWSATSPFVMSWPLTSTADHLTLPAVDTATLAGGTCTRSAGEVPVCRDLPKIKWEPVDGALSYRVYLALDAAYSNVAYVADVVGLEWVPYFALRDSTAGQAYYYAVQACTNNGCGRVTSTPASFRKRSPAVVPTGPAQGASIGADVGQVMLSWQDWSQTLADTTGTAATSGPQSYRVQVTTEDDPDFTDPLLDAEVDETAYVPPTVRLPDGRLLWRVQAVDASGNRLPFSSVHRFTRDATRPTAALLDTSPLAVDGAVVLRFSEPVTGVTAASLRVSPAAEVTVRLAADRLSAVLTPARRWLLGARHTVELAPTVTDLAGNPVQPAAGDLEVVSRADDGSPALGYAGRWSSRIATNALGGGFHASTPTRRAQTAVTTELSGNGVRFTGCQGPTGGLADLYVNGVKRARIDTYRRYSGCGVTLAEYALPVGHHQVQLRGLGLKRPASRGTALMIDAVDALH